MPCSALSIVMPCLNEANTIGNCIQAAQSYLLASGMNGEIIVADNGSTDESVPIAINAGASVVSVKEKGYGAALHAGIVAAKGTHIVFADADESYDFKESEKFVAAFNKGADVVIGNRFLGGIEKNAMPFLHRYLGTPIISFLGRKSFKVTLSDFNCGMRGIRKDVYNDLQMQSKGMEFATEMIARSAYNNLSIAEVPVKLYKDKRNRPPHLNTWTDGWRHLKLILMMSPKWLLLFPALFFLFIGLVLGVSILWKSVTIFNVQLDIHTLYFCSVFLILFQTFFEFYYLASFFGNKMGLHHQNNIARWITDTLSFEKGIIIGLILFFTGTLLSAAAVFQWYKVSFSSLNPVQIFRVIIPGGFLIIAGLQFIVFCFFISMIKNSLK